MGWMLWDGGRSWIFRGIILALEGMTEPDRVSFQISCLKLGLVTGAVAPSHKELHLSRK
jgi:hypothetical protein